MCLGGLPLGRRHSDVYGYDRGGGHDDAHGGVHHASNVHRQSIGVA